MITRLLQAGIMGAWATFFTWLFAVEQPTLARLLHPRLWWLVLAGAVVLTWWLGIYGLVFGAVLLFLAFQLRSARKKAGR